MKNKTEKKKRRQRMKVAPMADNARLPDASFERTPNNIRGRNVLL
jgi:hypothetical protein